MNTVSIATSRIGVPAAKPMYDSALAAASRISPAGHSSGSGTAPSRGTPWPGLVPRVDAVDEDGWRTNKPTLLRLLLTGNHGRTDRLRSQADPIESQAQHRQGHRFVRTVRHDKELHIHNAHLAPLKPSQEPRACRRNSYRRAKGKPKPFAGKAPSSP